MRNDIETYVHACITCQKMKFVRYKEPGLLQLLLIPHHPWEALPWICLAHNMAMIQFGSLLTGLANMHIICLSRRPSKKIIWSNYSCSRCLNIMVCPSQSWETGLHVSFGEPGKLEFPSTYHLETDGQNEAANSAVLDLLECYVADQKTSREEYVPRRVSIQ